MPRFHRWSTPIVVVAAALALVSACSRNRADSDRPRTEPPPVVDTDDPGDRDDPRGTDAAEEERMRRERAMADLTEPIYFDFDRSELQTHAREALQRKGEVLRDYPEFRIRIEGHADERGTVEYNLALGERRADAARQYLVDLGIDPDRLTTVSYGEERPAVEGSDESAWSRNRRDEFVPQGG